MRESSQRVTEPTTTPFFIPRGLVMLTAGWVFLSWIWLFGLTPPVQAQAASYAPSIRLLFASIGVGIGVAWPLLRLSGRASSAPIAQCTCDALAVTVILQVVIWPLRLVTNWTLTRTLVLDAAITLSIITIASVLSLALATQRERTRSWTMGALSIAALGPSLITLLTGLDAPGAASAFSVPSLLALLAGSTPLDPPSAELLVVKVALGIAVFWLLCAGISHFVRQSRRAHLVHSTD